MKRLAILTALLSACTGTVYPYSQPMYGGYAPPPAETAVASVETVESEDGDTTTTTSSSSTVSVSFQASGSMAQSAYAQPAYAQPATYHPPAPPPKPSSLDSRCHRNDSLVMCDALTLILDVGELLTDLDDSSCHAAAKTLNRYADDNGHKIDALRTLEQRESPARVAAWERRNRANAEVVLAAALELDQRCDGNKKIDRVLRRLGFEGAIGGPGF